MTSRDRDEELLTLLDQALSAQRAEGVGDSTETPELREALELMGLLAYELEPVPPHPRVKGELFERLGLEPSSDEAGSVGPGSEREGLSDEISGRLADTRNRWASTPPWLTTLAAAAVLLAVALGLFSGALLGRLRDQNREMSRLADRLDRLEALGEVDELRAELTLARDRLDLVTSPASEVCALSPRSSAQPEARGAVFMNRRSRAWVLAAMNLAPSMGETVYSLWFQTDGGTVRGGTFRIDEPSGRIEISSDDLPEGTQAILITLEPEGAEAPGETVLFGDEARHIL